MGFIGPALLILLAVTIVGHGLWLLAAAVWRALFGRTPVQPSEPWQECPGCGQRNAATRRRCTRCLLDQQSGQAKELADIRSSLRQVVRIKEMGEIEETTARYLLAKLQERREELLAHAPVLHAAEPRRPPPAPAPAEPAPITRTPVAAERPAPAAAEPQAAPVPTPPAAAPPRKKLAELLAAFMEERNILWGELVGGLLIVGCSIALVIPRRPVGC